MEFAEEEMKWMTKALERVKSILILRIMCIEFSNSRLVGQIAGFPLLVYHRRPKLSN